MTQSTTTPAPLSDERIAGMRARLAAATPGPWAWFGNTKWRNCYLATQKHGRRYVMEFARWGMRAAQPVFQTNHEMRTLEELVSDGMAECDHNHELIHGIQHPDAELIANAPADLSDLLTEVERLRADSARLDWMQGNPHGLACYNHGVPGLQAWGLWPRKRDDDRRYADIRDAIDAGRTEGDSNAKA